ncbi:uncharacterized protein LOC111709098 [Eurytemora carolleeae]|uniref:uncharacterized protein LOC111709098 n=1 Tax=Eurytemora carolleeae TaxID=1294199 RepID=UPI000C77A980|nr:uncharacterized protein LOC111709098 [Eurytemora carolleeae]|eukprot:XP_023338465.1 uncharacterized protein LOC111709098 [Eurytemora affinis]
MFRTVVFTLRNNSTKILDLEKGKSISSKKFDMVNLLRKDGGFNREYVISASPADRDTSHLEESLSMLQNMKEPVPTIFKGSSSSLKITPIPTTLRTRGPEEFMANIRELILPIQNSLAQHKLFPMLNSREAIQVFMQLHVYAVWDSLSMLKCLQKHLTCESVPWVPLDHPEITRLINHLVLLEESDLDWNNKPHSHFEMYLDAMKQMHVDTSNVENFVELIRKGMSVLDAINSTRLEEGVAEYLKTTHEIVSSGKVHVVAGAFAFSREVIIPQIFSQILDQQDWRGNHARLSFYLQRHVDLAGEGFEAASVEMVKTLCGWDKQMWDEANRAAQESLRARNRLFNAIAKQIKLARRVEKIKL